MKDVIFQLVQDEDAYHAYEIQCEPLLQDGPNSDPDTHAYQDEDILDELHRDLYELLCTFLGDEISHPNTGA